eukprot:scaffold24157_cov18-Tisochrysis_lutea.AAC.5
MPLKQNAAKKKTRGRLATSNKGAFVPYFVKSTRQEQIFGVCGSNRTVPYMHTASLMHAAYLAVADFLFSCMHPIGKRKISPEEAKQGRAQRRDEFKEQRIVRLRFAKTAGTSPPL